MVAFKEFALNDRLADPYAISVVNSATTTSLVPAKLYLVHYQKILALQAAPHDDS
jgi:hypothetical protein